MEFKNTEPVFGDGFLVDTLMWWTGPMPELALKGE
jgi:hypothetical protein